METAQRRGMSTFRAGVHRGALVSLTWLSACAPPYAGAQCEAISLQTLPATLPLGPRSPVEASAFRLSDPFILGTPELGCCVMNPFFTVQADCSAVDCDELRSRLTRAKVGGSFENEPCGATELPSLQQGGVSSCTVFLDGEKVVGVRAFCFD